MPPRQARLFGDRCGGFHAGLRAGGARVFFTNWFEHRTGAAEAVHREACSATGRRTAKPSWRESMAPPPPDDRPYDTKPSGRRGFRAVDYLRELCGAGEGQLGACRWRRSSKYEGTTAVRRAKLVNSFNDGYRGYRRIIAAARSWRVSPSPASRKKARRIAAALAKPQPYVNRTRLPIQQVGRVKPDGNGKPKPGSKRWAEKPDANKTGCGP